MAGPAAVLVLDAFQGLGNVVVPFLPFVAAPGLERFADLQVAQKLLTAIGAKAAHKAGVLKAARAIPVAGLMQYLLAFDLFDPDRGAILLFLRCRRVRNLLA